VNDIISGVSADFAEAADLFVLSSPNAVERLTAITNRKSLLVETSLILQNYLDAG
jgi:hypothetical protein